MDEPMITSDGAVDAELVSSYLAGDRSALGSIYDRYGQSLFDTATAMTNNRDDASDMVQDVFVLAAERLGQLRDPSRLKPWLFAILRNEVYRRSRRRSRQAITDFSAPEHDAMLPLRPPLPMLSMMHSKALSSPSLFEPQPQALTLAINSFSNSAFARV